MRRNEIEKIQIKIIVRFEFRPLFSAKVRDMYAFFDDSTHTNENINSDRGNALAFLCSFYERRCLLSLSLALCELWNRILHFCKCLTRNNNLFESPDEVDINFAFFCEGRNRIIGSFPTRLVENEGERVRN